MIRRPPRSTHCISSAASDVYKRQIQDGAVAVEDFLPGFENALEVNVLGDALHDCPALLGCSLLVVDVYGSSQTYGCTPDQLPSRAPGRARSAFLPSTSQSLVFPFRAFY
eukprot:TRINITY_DN196_c0_g1_i31.p2 TRINITY_DN196_c0_g1~~TRINITY_DN196_c0_g1_i31.p2  ORF type:complete len:119 (+),score=22.36 TRINITY_DN196_c0_g1_i31:30-359(+)